MPTDPQRIRALRRKAEKLLSEAPEKLALTSTKDLQKLVHSLSVYQIELEMQNEELRRSREQLEQSRSEYAELYDFAPVGYLTFDKTGLVTRANLTACGLLGVEKSRLVKKPFSLFIDPDSQDTFYFHKQRVLETTTAQTCQLVLKRKDGPSFHVQLESLAVQVNGQPAVNAVVTDISERTQGEEQLLIANFAIRTSIRAIAFADLDGRITYVNESFIRLWGYEHTEEVLGRHLSEFALLGVEGEGLTAMQPGRGYLGEGDSKRKDGSPFHWQMAASVVKTDEGKPVCMMASFVDITDRKQAEDALRESETKLRAILDGSRDAIGVSKGGIHTFVNPAYVSLFGYESADELIGTPIMNLIAPKSRAFVAEMVKKRARGQAAPTFYEATALKRDGTTFLMEATISSYVLKGEQFSLVILRDITRRKRAEQKISQLAAIVQSSQDAVISKSLDGIITSWNKGAEEIYGYTESEVIGNPISILIPPERSDEVLQILEKIKSGEHVKDYETMRRKKDGRDVHVSLTVSPIRDAEGRIVAASTVGRDITERKRAEESINQINRNLIEAKNEVDRIVEERTSELTRAYERLRVETEELQRAEAQLRQAHKMEAVGTLAGGIAHDFNNILASIIGFSGMARDKTPEGSPIRRHMEKILTAGIRGRDLVKQILAFSRQAEQEKLPFKLAHVVRETLGLLRASLPSTIDIRMNLQSESGFVLADHTQMQQVVMNLCTNAAHAMRRRGGSISVGLTHFSFSSPQDAPDPAMKPGAYARLSVMDTGEGMSPEIVDHIFDPFFTTKPAGEGTGLGLSVVHGIVASHGGTITVSSEPGRGSTFTVYLPKFLEEQIPDSGSRDGPVPRGRESILFVDDEADLAAMGDEMLTDLGYHVTARTGAKEALALFGLDPARFDLVITDQTMPEMTGEELVKEILAIRADMPIIMCTGYSPLVDNETARAAGVSGFAMKPLTRQEIAITIRKVLDR
jgi:PAS domain S-box-containing protein